MIFSGFLASVAFASTFFAGPSAQTQSDSEKQVFQSEDHSFQMEVLTEQDDVVWGFDFLPDGRILFSLKEGKLRVFDPSDGSVKDITGAPKVWTNGQGGLLDVRVHPENPSKIFLTYAEPTTDGGTTALASATLSGQKLTGLKKLFSSHGPSSDGRHFGSRVEFDGKGHVFVTIGDRGQRAQVQDLSYHTGSVVRLKEDGSVPKDNPFVGRENAKPEIWTYGHRSPQGMKRHPTTGELWLAEMGPRGGDELNLLRKGENYGWPEVTLGREYSGGRLGVESKPGMVDPVVSWVPSISPSGMTIYSGDAFPKWQGDFFLGTLSGQHLRRVEMEDGKPTDQEVLLKDQGLRIRCVRTGPEGFIYFSTDSGLIARLTPKD